MIAEQNSLLDALPAAVFVVQQQRFAYVNRAFADMMGAARHELIDHDSLERVHPDDRNVAPQFPLRDGRTSDGAWVTQIRIRRNDGAERSLAITAVPFHYSDVPALLGTAVDVTPGPDVLNVSVRMAALGRLAGGIAHDFNNLLLVIGGELERLQSQWQGDGDVRGRLETIAVAVDRAAMLTDQLLSFGRRQMLAPQVLDLSRFIADIESQLQNRLGNGVRLVVDAGRNIPQIRADGPRLREVLWHLADNARDAMPEGGTLTVAVDQVTIDADLKARWAFLALGGEFVRLRIVDTGGGMNAEVMPHVFEPFFTTKGRGRGAGMGLASVYGIVKQSAGYVYIERTGAGGTCVTILLPAATDQDEPRPVPLATAAGRRETDRRRILLVEDDMAVRELLDDVLTAHGFSVSSAETAEQAELQAANSPFDLLLSDIDLPGMSGARLAASLSSRLPSMQIMLMSGYPDDGEIAQARLEGRAILLKKPFSTTALVDRIRQALAPDQ
jgi:PAS domain S-box-containing protein